jgi:hypothetical protein
MTTTMALTAKRAAMSRTSTAKAQPELPAHRQRVAQAVRLAVVDAAVVAGVAADQAVDRVAVAMRAAVIARNQLPG